MDNEIIVVDGRDNNRGGFNDLSNYFHELIQDYKITKGAETGVYIGRTFVSHSDWKRLGAGFFEKMIHSVLTSGRLSAVA